MDNKEIFLYHTQHHSQYFFYEKESKNIVEVSDPTYSSIFTNKKSNLILYSLICIGILIGSFFSSDIDEDVLLIVFVASIFIGLIIGIKFGKHDRKMIKEVYKKKEKQIVLIPKSAILTTFSTMEKNMAKHQIIFSIVLLFFLLNAIVLKNIGFVLSILFFSFYLGTNLIAIIQSVKNKKELKNCWIEENL